MCPLKLKSQVRETFPIFKALVENHFNMKVGTLYSDNGGEFLALRKYLDEAGISHLTSPPHTPEHNGISERKHRHIVETGLTLLTHSGMPKSYWSYAFVTATYLINRLPTPVLNLESLFHNLFNTQPNYNKIRVYRCLCFPWIRPYTSHKLEVPWIRPYTSHKLEDRSTPYVFIGYSPSQSAYLCLQPQTGRIFVSQHVRFDEGIFPYKSSCTSPETPTKPIPEPQLIHSPPVTTIPVNNPLQTTNQNPQPPLVEQTGSMSFASHL